MHNLPANPMQPYVDYLHSMGITQKINLWCSSYEVTGSQTVEYWTCFIGRATPKQIHLNGNCFGSIAQQAKQYAEPSFDPISMGA